MVPTIDEKAVTEVVRRLSRDATARRALALAVASCNPAGLQRAVLNACGIDLSTEMVARLTSRDRLVSARQHLFML